MNKRDVFSSFALAFLGLGVAKIANSKDHPDGESFISFFDNFSLKEIEDVKLGSLKYDLTSKMDETISRAKLLGNEIFAPAGVYKTNISIPEGVTVRGVSAANIFSNNPKGTKFIGANVDLPVVSICGRVNSLCGAGLHGVCIDASASKVGLYIAGASYVNIDTVSVVNSRSTNILIECLHKKPTYFIFLKSVITYNAFEFNFKVLENLNFEDTFTTAIFCSNFISYTQPGKKSEGRIAYIQGQVIANGYWEDIGVNPVVIDRSIASSPGGLYGFGLIIDGESKSDVVKIITTEKWGAVKSVKKGGFIVPKIPNGKYYKCISGGVTSRNEPTWSTELNEVIFDGSCKWICSLNPYSRVNNYLHGDIYIDGNIVNESNGLISHGPFGGFQDDYSLTGIVWSSFDNPQIVGSQHGMIYSYYDASAKSIRKKMSQPLHATDGSVVVGVECGFTAPPTAGNWNVGDFIHNANPKKGGFLGWVCTQSGIPGEWAKVGNIG